MVTVAVTGSSGKLGRHVVRDLHEHGYRVVALDRVADLDSPADAQVRVELTDHGQVREALTGVDDRHDGVDAVVHLAAIPAPGLSTNAATYNVFAAARSAGVRNVVWASSETVLGLPFDTPPPYLPVDEEYPPRPQIKMIGLRFSNVMDPDDYAAFGAFHADPRLRRWNLWAYIDGRDGAQAVRRALELDSVGADVFIIANPDTVMPQPSADLAAAVRRGRRVGEELDRHGEPPARHEPRPASPGRSPTDGDATASSARRRYRWISFRCSSRADPRPPAQP